MPGVLTGHRRGQRGPAGGLEAHVRPIQDHQELVVARRLLKQPAVTRTTTARAVRHRLDGQGRPGVDVRPLVADLYLITGAPGEPGREALGERRTGLLILDRRA